MYFEMRKVRTDMDVLVDTAQKRALEPWGMGRSSSAVMEQRHNSSHGGHTKKVKNPVKT